MPLNRDFAQLNFLTGITTQFVTLSPVNLPLPYALALFRNYNINLTIA